MPNLRWRFHITPEFPFEPKLFGLKEHGHPNLKMHCYDPAFIGEGRWILGSVADEIVDGDLVFGPGMFMDFDDMMVGVHESESRASCSSRESLSILRAAGNPKKGVIEPCPS